MLFVNLPALDFLFLVQITSSQMLLWAGRMPDHSYLLSPPHQSPGRQAEFPYLRGTLLILWKPTYT